MKKVSLIIGLLATAMLAGGVTAYTVTKSTEKKTEVRSSFASNSGVGTHFTAYDRDNYPDLTYAAENAVKAVVNISVTSTAASSGYQGGYNPFYEFFGYPQQQQQPRESQGTGSGVIISSDGYIVTNHHVVDRASKMEVTLEDNTKYEAKLIGTDPTTEVALIKIEASNLPTLSFGDSDKLRLGEWVLAIGSPYELSNTVTAGIVSAKARDLRVIPNEMRIESFIQTDAAVNPGNSGGALVNVKGELVGINTVIKSPTGSFAGYSFAVPSAIVQKIVVDLKEYGVVQRAVLGVSIHDVNADFLESEEAKKAGIKEIGGAYVAAVVPEGAAAAVGIKEGDVITEIDGARIDNATRLTETVARFRPNDKVSVTVKRNGQVKQFDVTLRNMSGSTSFLDRDVISATDQLKGQFGDLSDRGKKELNLKGGAVVRSVESGGLLERGRIRRGSVITQINDAPIQSASQLNRITESIEYIEGITPDGKEFRLTVPRN